MTTTLQATEKKEFLSISAPGRLCFGMLTLFCLLLTLRNADVAIASMHRGLQLCAKTVIPSLFPFMVLSELMLSCGIGEWLLRPISPLLQRLFRLPEKGCCAAVLGMLCGFPIGARCAISAMEAGEVSQEETERLLCFCNIPSSAFLINAVGVSLWGNRPLGSALYLCLLFIQILSGILLARFPKKQKNVFMPCKRQTAKHSKSLAGHFTAAVQASCNSMLLICAYIIFFSAIMGAMRFFLDAVRLPEAAKAWIVCCLELSGGMNEAAALSSRKATLLLSAFAAGWSGLSVHCQLLSVCDGHHISLRPYLCCRLLQALACVLLFALLLLLFPQLASSGVYDR